MIPRCTMILADIFSLTEPSQARLKSLSMATEVGLRAGDQESAFTCVNIYLFCALQTGGVGLDRLLDESSRYINHMKLAKHHCLCVANLLRQCMCNFLDTSNGNSNPTDLSPRKRGNGPQSAGERDKRPLIIQYRECVIRLQLACFFHDYEAGKSVMTQCDDIHEAIKMLSKSSQGAEETFFAGILSAAIAGDMLLMGNEQGEKYSSCAKAAVRRYEELTQYGLHFRHRLAALKAEVSYHIDKDFDKASALYDESIRLAGEHNFVHEQALVCELAGTFQKKELIDYETARNYFKDAKNYYIEWGSKRKAVEMDERIEELAVPMGYLWF